MLQRHLGRPPKTYSMGFAEAGYDEMEYARIAARHFGTEHHEYYVTPSDLVSAIPRIAAHYDQPFGNSSAAPALVCAERARADGVRKLLAGDGGDELFGGNQRYAQQRVFGWYEAIPSPLRARVLEPLLTRRVARKVPLVKKAASYVDQARVPMPHRMQTYNLLVRIGPEAILEPGFCEQVNLRLPEQMQLETWRAVGATTNINRMLAFDWKYTLTDNDLPKVVETTRLAGVEVGFPLLSDDLVEFSASLPPEWKLKRLKLRWFFKDALKEFLPPEILVKKKHGFGLPFGAWAYRDARLRALATDATNALSARGVVRKSFVERLFAEYLPAHPGYYGELVWNLTMLELWLEQHAPSWRT
jgi:asparagine synthase (glutamine-hydrolysing)